MTYLEFMKNPPKYIFDGFSIWEHRVCTPFHKVPGYIKMDRMKSGKFRVNRRKSLIYMTAAYSYLMFTRRIKTSGRPIVQPHFTEVKDPNENIVWVDA